MIEIEDTFHLHFPWMILASLALFHWVIWLTLGQRDYRRKFQLIFVLSLLVVVVGMLFGKYGANFGLPWWIYYPVPMLMNVLLPPLLLKMNSRKTVSYLILGFLSAPMIHFFFSFFLNWTEYMPFWEIPYYKAMLT
ncbi:hypothetical protein TH61_00475 [Rufibacter sp. DG15C]|uniref:hypothetical protein n=1 Tax=Rufibacter sp. DG15C TaxID=1379909 RepID=UPI00078EDF58|nr:hypothetical protein [Rufibacter sp. DG15C]AMM49955.1 hypothetical protein TH61_00475 [Rufibacter sp. DG15C]